MIRRNLVATKTLIIYPEKCNGCKDCETACAKIHSWEGHPGRAVIKVLQIAENDGFHLPTTCRQCEEPPCLAACPVDAISKDEDLDRVVIDHDKCVGCKMCFSACPFGAIEYDDDWGKSIKCDLCGGEPACVSVCDEKALIYAETEQMPYPQRAQSALKMAGIMIPM